MGAPQAVLQQGASEERGENARMASFVGALAIADLVKSTLGPKGMVSCWPPSSADFKQLAVRQVAGAALQIPLACVLGVIHQLWQLFRAA